MIHVARSRPCSIFPSEAKSGPDSRNIPSVARRQAEDHSDFRSRNDLERGWTPPNKKPARLATRRLLKSQLQLCHTLTSGPREAGPLEPPPGPPGFGFRGAA